MRVNYIKYRYDCPELIYVDDKDVPRVGDMVEIEGIYYLVTKVIWRKSVDDVKVIISEQ